MDNKIVECVKLSLFDRFFVLPAIFCIVYVFSIYLLPYYVGGDQAWYRSFYFELKGAPFNDVLELQRLIVGGSEPIYGFLMWLGAYFGFDKDYYVGFFNSVFAMLLFALLRRYKVNYVVVCLCFLNFYFLVLLTSAERLKFGYILLFLSFFFAGYSRYILATFSILAHFQMIINILSLMSFKASLLRWKGKVSLKGMFVFSLAVSLGLVFLFFLFSRFGDALSTKLGAYTEFGGIEGMLNFVLLFILAIWAFPVKKDIIYALIPVAFAIFILGPYRANMVAVFMWFFVIFIRGASNHPAVYILLIYFMLKGFQYISFIIMYGNGFHKVY